MSDKIYCFGDSNTFGFDPRGTLGGRYEEAHRFPERLGMLLGRKTENGGLNGRTIPRSEAELSALCSRLKIVEPGLMIVLLGTNDLLTPRVDAEEVSMRMEDFLDALRVEFPALPLLLLAPPPIQIAWVDPAELSSLRRSFAELAEDCDAVFADVTHDLPLSYDGVHLSEEAHSLLAGRLAELIREKGL